MQKTNTLQILIVALTSVLALTNFNTNEQEQTESKSNVSVGLYNFKI